MKFGFIVSANENFDRLKHDDDDDTFYDDDVASDSREAGCPFTPGISTPDCNYKDATGGRVIPDARDLQDFTRLWICGMTSNVLANLPTGASITLSMENVSGNPTIDLFTAAIGTARLDKVRVFQQEQT